MSRFTLLASLGLALSVNYAVINDALAQQPTQQQRDAIRASCRSDFIANCAGVEPGGRDAFECLLRNQSKLSDACQDAVSAVASKPAEPAAASDAAAPAASAPQSTSSDDQLKSVQKACTISDLMAHCSWLQPTNLEILLCLKANSSDLSPGCRSVVQSLPGSAPAAPPATAPERRVEPAKKPAEPAKKPAEPEHASTESAPKKPTSQQLSAIRASCRSDFISNCSGVQPGGSAALRCLQSNAAQLSGGCRSALAAVAGGRGGTAAPATSEEAPATSAPAAAPMGSMPQISPREALGILRICGPDVRVFCADVPMGGGRLIRCLAENASSVSPSCQAALAAAAGR
jgi:hypothetical protein